MPLQVQKMGSYQYSKTIFLQQTYNLIFFKFHV